MVANAYWDALLTEYANKHDRNHVFLYSNYGANIEKEVEKTSNKIKNTRKKKLSKKYGLGELYPEVYFTSREYDCISQLQQGKTIKGIAKLFNLSPRTVEFYIKNVKTKLDCATRDELLNKVSQLQLEEITS